eukprot:c32351_g1_i1.p1 GENE.c32351_g1_i1~~c32351_g1_i1.p1  ORF type:complete len:449 (+),score=123.54 c32351_g1_i1:98-1348(+)
MMDASGTSTKSDFNVRPSISSTHASTSIKYRILTAQGIEAVKRYKYSGCDLSLYYEYFASPWANWLVQNVTPMWLAPNVITLSGFFLTLAWHLVIFCYAPHMNEQVGGWVGWGAAITTFVYQTMDNMDGKQARRTFSSSAVGQLLDHGCDAVITSLFALNSAVMLRIGGSRLEHTEGTVFSGFYPYMFVIALTGVYLTQWEEFHTGSFRLDIINGPNEGILFIILIGVMQAVSSPNFAHTPLISKYSPLDMALMLTIVAGAATNLAQMWRVWGNVRPKCKYFDKRFPRLTAIWRLAPIFLIDSFVVVLAGDQSVADRPFLFYWTVGLNFALFDIMFTLRLLCEERPTLFPVHLWPMIIILASYTFSPNFKQYTTHAIAAYLVFTVLYFVRTIHRMFFELCTALDIRMFRIVPRDGL